MNAAPLPADVTAQGESGHTPGPWTTEAGKHRMWICTVGNNPGDHRYTHGTISGGNGKRISFILDGFGPEETRHDFVCGRWDNGKSEPPFLIEEFPE